MGPRNVPADSRPAFVTRKQQSLCAFSEQGATFANLYQLLETPHWIRTALGRVLQNRGSRSPGVDGKTKADYATTEQREALVQEIVMEMREKRYRPRPARRVFIPKASDPSKLRPLAVPCIKDRCVQQAMRMILEPIYEPRFYPHSYGFRPFRSAHHALARIHSLGTNPRSPYTWVIEGDIRDCFGAIDHAVLLGILRRTIRDRSLLHVVRLMLKAGVMENLKFQETETGSPQGGVVSPLLANIYLSELDRFIASKYEAVATRSGRSYLARSGRLVPCSIVRYADDFVVMVRGTEEQAQALKDEISDFLRETLHMELSPQKTLVTAMSTGLTFLGYEIKAIWGKRDGRYKVLTRPSKRATQRYRKNVGDILARLGRKADLELLLRALNSYIGGWGQYFAAGVSSTTFQQLDHWTHWAVARMLLKRDAGRRHHGWRRIVGPHQIPWRNATRKEHRHRQGRGLGVWLDSAHTRALLLDRLGHIPIQYARQFGMYCPYRPEDLATLRRRRRAHQNPNATFATWWLTRLLAH